MDRFIVFYFEKENLKKVDLKSNMDRFIDFLRILSIMVIENLKSNMDRFIAPRLQTKFMRLQI